MPVVRVRLPATETVCPAFVSVITNEAALTEPENAAPFEFATRKMSRVLTPPTAPVTEMAPAASKSKSKVPLIVDPKSIETGPAPDVRAVSAPSVAAPPYLWVPLVVTFA